MELKTNIQLITTGSIKMTLTKTLTKTFVNTAIMLL